MLPMWVVPTTSIMRENARAGLGAAEDPSIVAHHRVVVQVLNDSFVSFSLLGSRFIASSANTRQRCQGSRTSVRACASLSRRRPDT